MNGTAEIILATGGAIALVLFALNGPLHTVINRGARRPPTRASQPLTTKQLTLLLSAVASAAGLATVIVTRLLGS